MNEQEYPRKVKGILHILRAGGWEPKVVVDEVAGRPWFWIHAETEEHGVALLAYTHISVSLHMGRNGGRVGRSHYHALGYHKHREGWAGVRMLGHMGPGPQEDDEPPVLHPALADDEPWAGGFAPNH